MHPVIPRPLAAGLLISKTLTSIVKGVKSANKELSGITESQNYYWVDAASNHKDRSDGYIKFDVAVTVSAGKETKGSAGIRVLSIGLEGERGVIESDQTVSRIKFGIAPSVTIG